jgi:hypothetical protein
LRSGGAEDLYTEDAETSSNLRLLDLRLLHIRDSPSDILPAPKEDS